MLLWHSRTITQFTTANISLVKDKCFNAVHVNVALKMFPSLSNLALSAQSLIVRHMHFIYIIWTINGCHYHQMSRIKEDKCVYPFCNCWPYHFNVHICHEVGEIHLNWWIWNIFPIVQSSVWKNWFRLLKQTENDERMLPICNRFVQFLQNLFCAHKNSFSSHFSLLCWCNPLVYMYIFAILQTCFCVTTNLLETYELSAIILCTSPWFTELLHQLRYMKTSRVGKWK